MRRIVFSDQLTLYELALCDIPIPSHVGTEARVGHLLLLRQYFAISASVKGFRLRSFRRILQAMSAGIQICYIKS